jgi:hypothetical protein
MKKKQKDNDSKILIILVPVIFIVMIITYLVLDKWAVKSPQVCKYLGRLWIVEIASPENPNPRNGYFTYEELYK